MVSAVCRQEGGNLLMSILCVGGALALLLELCLGDSLHDCYSRGLYSSYHTHARVSKKLGGKADGVVCYGGILGMTWLEVLFDELVLP